jgi:plastocyanin
MSEETTPEDTSEEASGGTGDAVEIVEFEFEPEEITVPAGTTITFTNQDKAAHTATADDSSFDTEELGKGDSAEETFDEPGTYSYYCRFHVFMKGSVVVE